VLAIAVFSIAPYAGTLSHPLIADDQELILGHPSVGNPLDVSGILGSSYWGQGDDLYRPLTLWSIAANSALNRALGLPGEHTTGFHLINLLAHLAVCLVFFRLLLLLGLAEWGASVAALLFAVHPLHTEAVTTIVGRSELLAALFGLTFVLLHRFGRPVAAAAVVLLLALMSKESAITFLPLAILMDYCLPAEGARRRGVAYAIYGAVVAGWLALRAWALEAATVGTPFIDNPLVEASVWERLLTATRVQFDYLRLHLLPFGLSSDYSYDQIPLVATPFDLRVLGMTVVVVVAVGAGWWLRRTDPLPLFAVAGYAVLFSSTGNFLFPIGTIMGERLAYSPSLAVCLLMGYAAGKLHRAWGAWTTVPLMALVLFFNTLTIERNRSWRDWESYITAQVRSAPNSAKAHKNLAAQRLEDGDLEAAAESCLEATSIYPDYAEAWDLLGSILTEQAKPAQAVLAHRRATSIHPGFAAAWEHLAAAQSDAGEFGAAVESYRRAIELEPSAGRLHHGSGLALQRLERLDEAARAYREAIRLDPALAPSYSNLATIHATRGDLDEAARLWRKALEIDPDYAVARDNLELLERRLRR